MSTQELYTHHQQIPLKGLYTSPNLANVPSLLKPMTTKVLLSHLRTLTTKMPTPSTPTTLKTTLRTQIKSQLSSLPPSQISTQSLTAQKLILALPQYQRAQRLSIYLSMPSSECQTDLLVREALEAEKKVFVPYIHHPAASKRKVIDMLHIRSIAEFEGLETDSWGIPTLPKAGLEGRENAMGGLGLSDGAMMEPTEDGEGRKGAGEGTLDVVVLPGVAFDEGMNRLGHGGGFYDGFLSRFTADGTGKPFLVGLCLAEQMLPPGREIPTTYDDWIVDAVAVGDGRMLALDD